MSQIQLFDYTIAISNPMMLAIILLLPVIAMGAIILIQQPEKFEMVGIMLGVLLNIPYLLLLNILAEYMGWWRFAPSGNAFYNIPVELILGWAVFWGAVLPYLFKTWPLAIPVLFAVIVDIALMPQMNGLFRLGHNWLVGEAVLILTCLIPSILIFKLTAKRQHVITRAFIQSYIWGSWFVFLIPAITLHFEGKSIFSIFDWSITGISLFTTAMAASMLIGYAALWEFARKGRGTPIPFDPPQTLVTTGLYAYVANPLQISTLLMFLCMAIAYQSWLMLGPIIAHIVYCEIFVRWHQDIDIKKRFGRNWIEYKKNVKNWLPRL